MNYYKNYRRRSPKPYTRKKRTIETMGYKDLVPILDREFSKYIRLSEADDYGIVYCVTCNTPHFWKEITLGHYVGRWHHSTRWIVKNVSPQCRYCNSFKGGEQHKMRAYLVEKYGEGAILEVERLAEITKTENEESLREKIKFYRRENKILEGR